MKSNARHFISLVLNAAAIFLAGFIIQANVLANRAPRFENVRVRVTKPSSKATLHSPRMRIPANTFGSLPLSFEPNEGQAGHSVKYISHGSRYALFLTRSGATITLYPSVGDNQSFQKLDNKLQKKFENRKFGRALNRIRNHKGQKQRSVQIAMDHASPNLQIEAVDKLPERATISLGRIRASGESAFRIMAAYDTRRFIQVLT